MVMNRAGIHNVKGTRIVWTEERDALLLRLYGTDENAVIAARLGCSEPALRGRCQALGIRGRRWEALRWKEAQVDLLRRYYGLVPTVLLSAATGHTRASCNRKARELGLSHADNGAERAIAAMTGAAPDQRDDVIRELRLLLAAHMRPMHYITLREAAAALDVDEAALHHRAVRHAAAGAMLLAGAAR
jgi:hypothetical protein